MNRKERRLRRLRSAFQVAMDPVEDELEVMERTGIEVVGMDEWKRICALTPGVRGRLEGLREGLEIAEFVIREEQ